jgi:hypothetical protein
MQFELGSFIKRKIITTFVATTILSVLLGFFTIKGSSEMVYNQGEQFIGWSFIYLMYIGVLVLIYGNLVSIGTEYLQRKWFPRHHWLYVLILGGFGSANGLFFQEAIFAYYGMLAAILYGIIDRWLFIRYSKDKSTKLLPLIPIALLLVFWGYFHITSPPMPPFTKENAVKFATSGEGTAIDNFPKEIGRWEGTIDGYKVIRETNAKQIGEEMYIVTFIEKWRTTFAEGSWTFSFEVKRGSSTAKGETGKMPPYYSKN